MRHVIKFLPGLIAIISFISLVGCTHVHKITETPPLQMGSPLKSVEPRTFAFKEFQDMRAVEDPTVILEVGGHTHKIDQTPAAFVVDRIRKEFQRNGHRCLDASAHVPADFVVKGTIYKFSTMWRMGFFANEWFGNTGVKLTIERVPSRDDAFVKSYEGEFNGTSSAGPLFVESLGTSVQRMIKEISTDPELIDFIKK